MKLRQRMVALFLALALPAAGWGADLGKDLRKAVESGKITKVHEVLAKGAEVNAKDEKGVTALMIAAEKGQAEIVQVLLEAGADPNIQNKDGLTAPMMAEKNGYSDIAKLLKEARQPEDVDTAYEVPCETERIKARKEKGELDQFFPVSLPRVKEVMSDGMLAVGFKVKKQKGNKLEAVREYTELGGYGAGYEKLRVRFAEDEESGVKGVRIFAETKKGFVGRLRKKNWASAVLDQAACLFELLGPRTDEEVLAADSVKSENAESQTGREIALSDASPVKLRLRRYLFSKDALEGDRIAFQVSEDVIVDGTVVVKKDAIAWGHVTKADQTKMAGRGAKLNFTIDSVRAANGQSIRLRNQRDTLAGKSGRTTGSIISSYAVGGGLGLAILLFSHGKHVGVRAGTGLLAFVDGDHTLKATKVASTQ